MQKNKWVVSLFAFLLLLPMLCVPVRAEDAPEFRYELTVDGQDTVEVQTGDVITVTLYLYRTDKDATYDMYAMQDEIRYDSKIFELVEDSAVLSNGIHSTDLDVGGGMREFYMNYVSFSGGSQWQSKTRIGSFSLRVIGTSGVSTITNEDFLVSHKDGMGNYVCEANALTVILSTECSIKFETNGGSKIDPIKAIYGEKLVKPEDPTREGMYLVGWYTDIHLSKEWNFDTDTVRGNMTLYAKWAVKDSSTDSEPPVSDTESDPNTESSLDTDSGNETEEPSGGSESKDETKPPVTGSDEGSCLWWLWLLLLILLILLAVAIYQRVSKRPKP